MELKRAKIEIVAFVQIWANGKVSEKYQSHVKDLVYLGFVRDTAGYLTFTQSGEVILDAIFAKLDRTEAFLNEVLEFK